LRKTHDELQHGDAKFTEDQRTFQRCSLVQEVFSAETAEEPRQLGWLVAAAHPDVFTFLQPELVELLEERVPQHLPTI
jgi:hypothetical protein